MVGPGAPKSAGIAPNQTLYVTNVPSSKVQKSDLRTALYMLFSTYGPVLDVVAMRTMKMRGQAHIVYRDVQTATQAMRALNGSLFLGKELKIEYAKSKSNAISKLDGTFKLPSSAAAGAVSVEVTDVQRSIFNAPAPGTAPADSTGAPSTSLPPRTVPVPAKPDAPADAAATPAASAAEGRGQKRAREEEDEDSDSSDGDVAMEEDSDDD